jgi:organic radical activating enzyme
VNGANPLRSRDRTDGHLLQVQGDPFLTIQGEGPYAGLPATFIRLWGCHLACSFCDTDFESDQKTFDCYSLARLCREADLVVLTGGEPMRQNIAPLVRVLSGNGKTIQVETAGNFWWDDLLNIGDLKIVVSPKTPAVNATIKAVALAWKYIISMEQMVDPNDGLPITNTQGRDDHPRPLAKPPKDAPRENIYLQPMDEGDEGKNAANLARCIRIAKNHGYRVSLQQHKIMGVP